MSTTAARPRTAADRGRKKTTARSGRARRRSGGIRWDRVSRLALLAVLGMILLSYLGPASRYVRSWQLSHETQAEIHQLRDDNARLRTESKRLQNSQQLEIEARRLGMARPGERAFVIKGLPPD
jgi:cell division protein FtsB